jgi:hypothetical protein
VLPRSTHGFTSVSDTAPDSIARPGTINTACRARHGDGTSGRRVGQLADRVQRGPYPPGVPPTAQDRRDVGARARSRPHPHHRAVRQERSPIDRSAAACSRRRAGSARHSELPPSRLPRSREASVSSWSPETLAARPKQARQSLAWGPALQSRRSSSASPGAVGRGRCRKRRSRRGPAHGVLATMTLTAVPAGPVSEGRLRRDLLAAWLRACLAPPIGTGSSP